MHDPKQRVTIASCHTLWRPWWQWLVLAWARRIQRQRPQRWALRGLGYTVLWLAALGLVALILVRLGPCQ